MSAKTHARIARERVLTSYRQGMTRDVKSHTNSVAVPEKGASVLAGYSPAKLVQGKPVLDTPQPQLYYPDEDRFFEITVLKRCPWCHKKPYVHKVAEPPSFITKFLVVHRDHLSCRFGPEDFSKSMKSAINLWNFAVNLATK